MPKKKRISKQTVTALRCRRGGDHDRSFLWDNALSGFGAVAFPSGKKVFIVQFRRAGRSRRMTLGEYGRLTAEEARKEARKILGAVETGKDPIKARSDERNVRTFRELADEFMRLHVGKKRKTATRVEYEGLLKRYLLPGLGSKRILDVRRVDVARIHANLSDTPFLANRCLSLVSSMWNWAARREEVGFADNPAMGVERYTESKRERFLTTDELSRLGEALRQAETTGIPWQVKVTGNKAKHLRKETHRLTKVNPHAVAALRLLILTGARLNEILGAKWEYVDFERSVMLLPESKTGRKTIYLSAPALTVLSEITHVDGNPYIFPGEKRRPPRDQKVDPNTRAERRTPVPRVDLKRPWSAIARVAGFVEQVPIVDAKGRPLIDKGGAPKMKTRSTVRLHDLRHSFASMGVGASLGLPIIGKLLGHANTATTERYSHLEADPMHKAANAIGGRIAAALEAKPSAKIIQIRNA